jgi:hypothetical protein
MSALWDKNVIYSITLNKIQLNREPPHKLQTIPTVILSILVS